MRLETNCKTVVRDCSIRVDICENSENTSGLGVRSTSVVVVDGKAGRSSGILECSAKCCVDERQIRHKSGAGPISCLGWPRVLVLHTLQGGLCEALYSSNCFMRFSMELTMPLETPSPTISLTTSQDVTDEPRPWISC